MRHIFLTSAVAFTLILSSCTEQKKAAEPAPPQFKIEDMGAKVKLTNVSGTSWPDYDVKSNNGFMYNGLITLPAGESVVIDKTDFLKGDKGLSFRFNPKKDKLEGLVAAAKLANKPLPTDPKITASGVSRGVPGAGGGGTPRVLPRLSEAELEHQRLLKRQAEINAAYRNDKSNSGSYKPSSVSGGGSSMPSETQRQLNMTSTGSHYDSRTRQMEPNATPWKK